MWDHGVNGILADEMARVLPAAGLLGRALGSRAGLGVPLMSPCMPPAPGARCLVLSSLTCSCPCPCPALPCPPRAPTLQGLGKTLQTISLLSYLKFERGVQVGGDGLAGSGVGRAAAHPAARSPLGLACSCCFSAGSR